MERQLPISNSSKFRFTSNSSRFGCNFWCMAMNAHRLSILIPFFFFFPASRLQKMTKTPPVFNAMSQGPTTVHAFEVKNCTFENFNGFLKEVCIINNHKYFKCSRSNRFYRISMHACDEVVFNRACPNDDVSYQACGRLKCAAAQSYAGSSVTSVVTSQSGNQLAVCGDTLCLQKKEHGTYGPYHTAFGGNSYFWNVVRCNGVMDCLNSVNGISVDEYGCENYTFNSFDCMFDVFAIQKERICDNVCDCSECEEEAKCNNMTVGVFCFSSFRNVNLYVRPINICDFKPDCLSGIDEKFCGNFNETCESDSMGFGRNFSRRVLTPWSKCSTPDSSHSAMLKVCRDYRDQMNCSSSTISPLVCNVDGYPTTISEHVICKGIKTRICDDNLEKACVDAEFECKIHKHRLCDGINDCMNGGDEDKLFCNDMVHHQINCIRRWSYTKKESRIPRQWVFDGISDCVNDVDEDPEKWINECGHGLKHHYSFVHSGSLGNESDCSSIELKCPYRLERISLDRICRGDKENCDFQVCEAARKDYQITSSLPNQFDKGKSKRLFHCLPGLQNLEKVNGKCSLTRLSYQKKLAGVDDLYVTLPEYYARVHANCKHLYGELYVYVACSGLCGNNITCPLKPLDVVLSKSKARKCFNYPLDKVVLSLADDNVLGLAIQKSGSYFSKAAFACKDGQCISFDKVCNLVVDCEDGSDEDIASTCSNNFKCNISGEYIPISKKCDGVFDCYDFSDECNDECENHIIMFNHVFLFVIALVFGISATVLNSITLFNGLREYPSLTTETAQVNKCFVLLITFSDLLQGLFLIMLSVGNKFFNKSTCYTQFEWTTSTLCTVLGIISTIGSLLSLYSMTILGIVRARKIGSMVPKREGMSRRKKILLGVTAFVLLTISTLVATLPLFISEDYFVQSMNYHGNSLFVGAPNKQKHMKIVYAYYGRVLHRSESNGLMSWGGIRNLVKDMFANGLIKDTALGFYGSNGFCLFSYFVRPDVSHRWFSLAILATNLLCVLIIAGCYIYVNVVARKTGSAVKSNEASAKSNRKLQRKITLIVSTDVLTWLPFIVVCIINYTELVDTSSWYSYFCIFFLPINSIINPIGIYDETILKWGTQIATKIKSTYNRISTSIRKMSANAVSPQQRPEEIEMSTVHIASIE